MATQQLFDLDVPSGTTTLLNENINIPLIFEGVEKKI